MQTFTWSENIYVVGKNPLPGVSKDLAFSTGFRNTTGTIEDYVATLTAGHATCNPVSPFGRKEENILSLTMLQGDWDGITPDQLARLMDSDLLRDKGIWNYSASYVPGSDYIKIHWQGFLEEPIDTTTPEGRKKAQLIKAQFTEELEGSDKKCKDLARLLFSGPGQEVIVLGGVVTRADVEALYKRALDRQKKEAAEMRKRLKKISKYKGRTFSVAEAEKLTQEYVLPKLEQGRFPDIKFQDVEIDSYNAWCAYFVGWADQIGLDAAADLMDKYAPDTAMGSLQKLASFQSATKERKYGFGTTMLILRYFGYEGESVIGKRYPINKHINQQRMGLEILPDTHHPLTVVVAAKGVGKTYLASLLREQTLDGFLAPTLSVLLARNLANRLDLTYYKDKEIDIKKAKDLCIVVNSMKKLDLANQHFAMMFLDEVVSFVKYLTTSGTLDGEGERIKAWRVVEYYVKDCLRNGRVLAADANFSVVEYNFFLRLIREIEEEEPGWLSSMGFETAEDAIYVIKNDYRSADGRRGFRHATYDAVVLQVTKALEDGKRVYIPLNSREKGKTILRSLRDKFPDKVGLLVDSDTNDEPDVRAFIDNPNHVLPELGIDYLIATTSMGTGVSIDVPYFHKGFVISENGITTHYELMQQVARVRTYIDDEIHFYVAPGVGPENLVCDRHTLRQHYIDNLHETAELVFKISQAGEFEPEDPNFFETFVDVMWATNNSFAYYDVNTVRLMKDEGYVITWFKSDKAEVAQEKAFLQGIKDELRQEKIAGIVAAEEMGREEAELVRQNMGEEYVTPEQKARLAKYEMTQFYGVEHKEVTTDMVTLDDDGRFRDRVLMLEVVAGLTDPAKLDEREAEQVAMRIPVKTVTGRGRVKYEYEDRRTARTQVSHRKWYALRAKVINDVLVKAGIGSLMQAYADGGYEGIANFGAGYLYNSKSLNKNGFTDWLKDLKVRNRITRTIGYIVKIDQDGEVVDPVGLVSYTLNLVGLWQDVRRKSSRRDYLVDQTQNGRMRDLVKRREGVRIASRIELEVERLWRVLDEEDMDNEVALIGELTSDTSL